MNNIKLFDVILHSNMSMSTYDLLKKHFMTELSMESIFRLQARILKLSHVEERSYDCCINSCCCYTGSYAVLDSCPFCKHTQHDSQGHPYQVFKYLPIKPCAKSLFLTDHYAEILHYCSLLGSTDQIQDVFDGIHYQTLLGMQVAIDGAKLGHYFFSDP